MLSLLNSSKQIVTGFPPIELIDNKRALKQVKSKTDTNTKVLHIRNARLHGLIKLKTQLEKNF